MIQKITREKRGRCIDKNGENDVVKSNRGSRSERDGQIERVIECESQKGNVKDSEKARASESRRAGCKPEASIAFIHAYFSRTRRTGFHTRKTWSGCKLEFVL